MNEEGGSLIRELLYQSVKSWRLLLALALIFGVLLGGMAVWKNRHLSFSEAAVTARQEVMTVTNLEVEALDISIKKNKEILEAKKEYLNQSILMKINPAAKSIVKMEVAVRLVNSQIDATAAKSIIRGLVANYIQTGKSAAMGDYIVDATRNAGQSLSRVYLQELLTISAPALDTISIESANVDAESAMRIANAALDYLRSYSLGALQIIQPNNLELLGSNSSVAADPALTAIKKAKEAEVETLKTTIKTAQDQQKAIITADLAANSQSSVPQKTIIGLMLGVLLGFLFQSALYTFDSRLKNTDEIQRKLGLYILGRVTPTISTRPNRSWIDKNLDKLFGKPEPAWSREESLQYTSASLANLITAARQANPANQYAKIFCTGTIDAVKLQGLASQLGALRQQSGLPAPYKCLVGDSLLTSSEALANLGQSDAVVIFEQVKHSRYEQVEEEINILNHMGKEILGLVIVADKE